MTGDKRILYSYWRSSASYRVRLALAWKRLDYRIVPIDLRIDEQSSADFLAHNPQGLVPFYVESDSSGAVADRVALGQSLAIIEYLDERHPTLPLLPPDAAGRAAVRAASQVIACDIHPVNNLRILRYLKHPLGHQQPEIDAWARHWIDSGFSTLELFAQRNRGRFLYGDSVTMADLCLMPQLYNARRVGSDLSLFANLLEIEATLLELPILAPAHPDSHRVNG